MPNNRRPTYRPPAIDRTAALYAGLISHGIVLLVRDGEIDIQTPSGTVNPLLRRQVEQHKAALLAYIAKLPAKSWTDVGRKDDFDEMKELEF